MVKKEWVPLGVFYTISWDAPEDSLYCHVTARDKLDRLRKRIMLRPELSSRLIFARTQVCAGECSIYGYWAAGGCKYSPICSR